MTENSDHIQVDLRIRLLADTFKDSAMNGEFVNMLVNETWLLSANDTNEFTIFDYQVTPVNH